MSPELRADLVTFIDLALKSRIKQGRSARVNQALGVVSTNMGISRALIQERLRRYWKTDWTFDRVTAVVAELAQRGVYKQTEQGYRTTSWADVQALRDDLAAVSS